MPTSTERIINESPAQLASLARAAVGRSAHRRFAMLQLFAENPMRSSADVAQRIGVSERTIKRWWRIYRSDGLAGLIGQSGEGVERTVPTTADAGRERSSADNGILPEHVIEFLNALPPQGDATQWPLHFRDALLKLLPDVDHVSVTVNMVCDLTATGEHRPQLIISQNLGSAPGSLMVNRGNAAGETATRLYDNFRAQGFPIKQYHPPAPFVYLFDDSSYLGAVFLWTEREKPQIDRKTLELFESLRPFLGFVLSDLVARFRYSEPVSASYIEAIEELSSSIGLTPSEQQVVILLADGQSQKMISESMRLSKHTVQTHMKSIYRKAGVKSVTELIARYLTPGRKRGPTEPTNDPKSKKGTRSGRK